eukprot:7947221-Pyramimonas_sp.AAC.1
MQKKGVMPCLGLTRGSRRLQEIWPGSRGIVRSRAMHLGARHRVSGSKAPEVQCGIRSMLAGWSVIDLSWRECRLHRLKRELFVGKVAERGVASLDAFAFKPAEYQRVDSCTAKDLRVRMRGAATSYDGQRFRPFRNSEVLYRFRILPARGELAARRIRWLRGMLTPRRAHIQTIAAIF